MSEAVASQAQAPLFNPMSFDFIKDPYPFYRRLREEEPLHESPLGFWVATRHEDVALVLRDRRFGKDYVARMTKRRGAEIFDEPCFQTLSRQMLVLDPPDHTRLRGLVVKAFTARRVEAMTGRIQQLVDRQIDAVVEQGEMDVIRDFAHPLPTNVICDMLGVPEADRAQFVETSRVSGRMIDPTPMTAAELAQANDGDRFLKDYFGRLFELRRREPGDDLTTQLVQVEEEGSRLSDEELVANVILLFAAGHETTVNLIGNGLLALHRNPDQLRKLQADPGLMANAVEELLRYDSSVQMTSRTALEDVELCGVPVAAGEAVITVLGSANRDPAAFDDPENLDIARPGVKPLSFGGGIHFCLGAQLARIEAGIALNTLFRRLPELQLSELDEPDWRPTFTLRGLKTMPATWA